MGAGTPVLSGKMKRSTRTWEDEERQTVFSLILRTLPTMWSSVLFRVNSAGCVCPVSLTS